MWDAILQLLTGPNRITVWVTLAFIALFIPSIIMRQRERKKIRLDYLAEHPDAVLVFVPVKTSGVVVDSMYIHSVNNEPVVTFFEGNRQGFFLEPGRSVVRCQYTWKERKGLGKSVTNNVNASNQEVIAEAGKKYTFTYDRVALRYKFSAIPQQGK